MQNLNYDVVIVGSGFSALAETIYLLRQLPPNASIAVIGDDPGFGRGTAYRTELHVHRLNVPAQRMSIFPDEPNDFVAWLERQQRDLPADGFASRDDFGRYLRDRLASALRTRARQATLHFIKAKAVSAQMTWEGYATFTLDNGSSVRASRVVLCLGVGNADLPVEPKETRGISYDRVIRNPWRLGWLSRVKPDDTVCILGSGLTMVDQVLALRMHGHRGAIHVLSRRGLVSHRHGKTAAVPPALPPSRDISVLLQALRKQVRDGAEWRGVMDGLRPLTQDLWMQLSRPQRSRFLRHALPWWSIHRHRLAPDVADRLEALVRDRTVMVHAGHLREISEENGMLHIGFRRRGTPYNGGLRVDWIVNCTGMERAGIRHSPLLQQMLGAGMIAAADMGLGIHVDGRSRVLDCDGHPQPGLYAIGALTAGTFWEITAVPDIRFQAARVAAEIVADVDRNKTS